MTVAELEAKLLVNQPLFNKLAIVNTPNLYGLFNTLIADHCRGNERCAEILNNKPSHKLKMIYDDNMHIETMYYYVSWYDANIRVSVNAININITVNGYYRQPNRIFEMEFERFYELYVNNVYVKD